MFNFKYVKNKKTKNETSHYKTGFATTRNNKLRADAGKFNAGIRRIGEKKSQSVNWLRWLSGLLAK